MGSDSIDFFPMIRLIACLKNQWSLTPLISDPIDFHLLLPALFAYQWHETDIFQILGSKIGL